MSQQLIDYVSQQVKSGVPTEQVRAALVGAGWAQVDIDEAMRAAQVSPAVSASVASAGSKPAAAEPATQSPATLSIGEVMAQPDKESAPDEKTHHGSVLAIVFGVLALLFLAGGVFLYFMMSDKLAAQETTKSTELQGTIAQVQQLTTSNAELTAQVASLEQKEVEAKGLLSFFIVTVPPVEGTSTVSQELPATLKGALSGGGKLAYVVTTDQGLRVTLVNGKAEKVNAALASLVGSTVEITGTHPDGSSAFTVKAVNGSSVE